MLANKDYLIDRCYMWSESIPDNTRKTRLIQKHRVNPYSSPNFFDIGSFIFLLFWICAYTQLKSSSSVVRG